MLRDARTVVTHLRDEIALLIEKGGLKPGDRIPTEAELTRAFGISRPALREALKLLEQDGSIRVEHGRGRFVAPAAAVHVQQPITHFESVTDMAQRVGYEPVNRIVSMREMAAEAEAADALHCPLGTRVVRLERLRSHGGRVLIYTLDVILRDLLPENLGALDWTHSLFDLLDTLGVRPRMSLATASAVTLPDAVRSWPELADFGPAFLISEVCYSDRGHPVVLAKNYHRGDAFTFSFMRK